MQSGNKHMGVLQCLHFHGEDRLCPSPQKKIQVNKNINDIAKDQQKSCLI